MMSNFSADDDKPLDLAAARIVAKVRWLMVIAGATTFVGGDVVKEYGKIMVKNGKWAVYKP